MTVDDSDLHPALRACLDSDTATRKALRDQRPPVIPGDDTISAYVRALGHGHRLQKVRESREPAVMITQRPLCEGCPGFCHSRMGRCINEAGGALYHVRTARSPAQVEENILRIAELLEDLPAGERLARRFKQQLQAFRQRSQGHRPATLAIIADFSGRAWMAGQDTHWHQLLEELNAGNAARGLSGYLPLTHDALVSLEPEAALILETREGAFRPGQWPALRDCAFWRAERWALEPITPLASFRPCLAERLDRVRFRIGQHHEV